VALNEKQSIDPREYEEVFAFSGWRLAVSAQISWGT